MSEETVTYVEIPKATGLELVAVWGGLLVLCGLFWVAVYEMVRSLL